MNIEIANKLQKLRKENGYSQEELADKLGISRQAVSKWERAESSPDTDNLIILAKLYNVSLDDLLRTDESIEDLKEINIEKEQERQNDSININGSTINLTDDEGQTVRISNNGVKFINKDGTEEKFNKKRAIFLSVTDSIIALATLIGYLLWSILCNAWYVSWTLWILMPAVMSIFEAIVKKRITKFVYPCFITALYCFLGMQYNLWHPYWILFITIPLFYVIFDPIDKYLLKSKPLDDDDDNDED